MTNAVALTQDQNQRRVRLHLLLSRKLRLNRLAREDRLNLPSVLLPNERLPARPVANHCLTARLDKIAEDCHHEWISWTTDVHGIQSTPEAVAGLTGSMITIDHLTQPWATAVAMDLWTENWSPDGLQMNRSVAKDIAKAVFPGKLIGRIDHLSMPSIDGLTPQVDHDLVPRRIRIALS